MKRARVLCRMAFPRQIVYSRPGCDVSEWSVLSTYTFWHERGIVRITQWEDHGHKKLPFLRKLVGTRVIMLARSSKHCRFRSRTCWKMEVFRCIAVQWLLIYPSLKKMGMYVNSFKSYSRFIEGCRWNNSGSVQPSSFLILVGTWITRAFILA